MQRRAPAGWRRATARHPAAVRRARLGGLLSPSVRAGEAPQQEGTQPRYKPHCHWPRLGSPPVLLRSPPLPRLEQLPAMRVHMASLLRFCLSSEGVEVSISSRSPASTSLTGSRRSQVSRGASVLRSWGLGRHPSAFLERGAPGGDTRSLADPEPGRLRVRLTNPAVGTGWTAGRAEQRPWRLSLRFEGVAASSVFL